LRVVARFSLVPRFNLVPAGFSDPISGRDRGLAGMRQARWRRLQQRLQERRQDVS
jgi:hypothetical protein